MIEFIGCNGADLVQSHTAYRLAFVPQDFILRAELVFSDRWPQLVQAQLDSLAGVGVIPAQGAPTIIDDSAGRSGVFDVFASSAIIGNTLQQMAQAIEDSNGECALLSMQRLSARGALENRPADQTDAGTGAAKTAAKDSLTAEIKTVAKYLLVGLALVAVVVVVSRVPKA